MTEIIENEAVIAPTVVELPRYTEALFKKFVDLTPDYGRENGQVIGSPRDTLDTINTWWRTVKPPQEGLDRFKSAFTLFGLPRLESEQVREEYGGGTTCC